MTSRASSPSEAPVANHARLRPALPKLREDSSDKSDSAPRGPETSPDVRARFRASKDYWDFAERIHDAAKHGDGASQYYLSVALDNCRNLYGYYYIEQPSAGPARIRTLDEAQQLTTTQRGAGFTPDDVQEIQSRCQRIMNTKPPPFGDAGEWMEAALASAYPLAQAHAATQKALQGIANPPTEKSRAVQAEARELMIEALRTKDAEVVLALSSAAAFLTGDAPDEVLKRQWTWVMAAYLRESNTASQAEWTKEHCTFDYQCHPDDRIIDIIRRVAGNDFDEIERRARELNEKIDAGTLEESDI